MVPTSRQISVQPPISQPLVSLSQPQTMQEKENSGNFPFFHRHIVSFSAENRNSEVRPLINGKQLNTRVILPLQKMGSWSEQDKIELPRLLKLIADGAIGKEDRRLHVVAADPAVHFLSCTETKSPHPPKTQENYTINGHICHAKDISELWKIWEDSGKSFNTVNLSTLVYKMSEIWDSKPCRENPFLDPRFTKIQEKISDFEDVFNARDLSNLVHAFSLSKINHPQFYSRINAMLEKASLADFQNEYLSSIALDFFVVKKVGNLAFLKAIKNEFSRREISEFKPNDLARIANAFIQGGVKEADLFQKIGNELKHKRLSSLQANCLSGLAEALVINDIRSDGIFEAIRREVWRRPSLACFSDRELISIVYSLAINGKLHDERLIDKIDEQICSRSSFLRELPCLEKCKLAYAYALFCASVKEQNPPDRSLVDRLKFRSENFLRSVNRDWISDHGKQLYSLAAAYFEFSDLFLEIGPILTKKGVVQEDIKFYLSKYQFKEFPNLGGRFACHQVDFFRRSDSLIVTVGEQCHFSETGDILPKTALRNAIMKNGFNFVFIPYNEWEALPQGEREAYLKEKFRQAKSC